MSASGPYHRRWSAGAGGRTTPTSSSFATSIEPSTYGTSWNSVRWNKPSTAGYRSHSSSIASRFEQPKPSFSSRYSSPSTSAARQAADLTSLGPSISSRISRFDTSARDTKDVSKYRSEARDLINKWTSRERNPASNFYSRHFSPSKVKVESTFLRKTAPETTSSYKSSSTDYPYRGSSRGLSSSTTAGNSRYSVERSSLMSPSPTPQSHVLKAERPWRQRMAESSRIRAVHGDEFASRHNSREGSVYGPSSRFTNVLPASTPYRPSETSTVSKYMSRSYSPIRSTSDVFRNSSSSRLYDRLQSATTAAKEPSPLANKPLSGHSSLESLPSRDGSREKFSAVSAVPKNPSIRESSREKDGDSRRRMTSKERTARRNSRQRSLNIEDSSSSDEDQTREDRRRRRKKTSDAGMTSSGNASVSGLPSTKSTADSLENGTSVAGLTNLILNLADKDVCPPSPSGKISRSNSKTRLPSKSQIIKSPSVVEVPGISRSDSKSSVLSPLSPQPINLPDVSQQQEESQYSAVAHFKPFKAKVKRLAPVPGMWNKPGGEENISKNKHFEKVEQNLTTFKIWKTRPRETVTKKIKMPSVNKKVETKKEEPVPVKKMILPKKTTKRVEENPKEKEKKTVEKSTELTKQLERKSRTATLTTVWKDKRRVSVSNPKSIKAVPRLAEIVLNKVFDKKPVALRILKTLRPKQKSKKTALLRCLAPVVSTVVISKSLKAKEEQKGAQVIVDTPQKGLNMSRVKLRVKAADRRSLPILGSDIIIPSEADVSEGRISRIESESDFRRSTSRAAEVLDEMRNTEPALEWHRDDCNLLILPDKSILEEYVKRKRGRLERLHSEPIRERDEISGCNSPCNSTTSELLPACTSQIYHPSPHGVPFITTPSRKHSVDSSSTPTAMLDTVQTLSFNNFNSTPQAFRAAVVKQQCAKPIQFDTPKSAFEERLQMQAHAIRKASEATSDTSEQLHEPSPRRGSDGMSSISNSFTSALAEKAGQQNRHERYAAHIPVNRNEGSGRQSAASVDSTQSGVLDTATKQLDQVIDQARHRHHQHRSKFKEAIDYLDQIFEDLKKECDVAVDENAVVVPNATNGRSSTSSTSNQMRDDRNRKPTILSPSSASKTNSLPSRGHKQHKHVQPPSPVDVVIRSPQKTLTPKQTPTPKEIAEFAVSETIVLPKKTDKLDFTRRWLHDDLSSITTTSPPEPVTMMPDSAYGDLDEHSLGSCSAEVAAINIKTSSKSKQQQPSKPKVSITQKTPIRPQPVRPQPQYGMPGSSTNNGSRYFPTELEPPPTSLQRVASYDQMTSDARRNDGGNYHWRSGSQEPYQTLQSVRSDADSRPSPSAFQNVSAFAPRGNHSRASLRSLPDASIKTPRRSRQVSPPKDPVLAIDQLVAELELNTDQPMTSSDKRRSFPTTLRTEIPEIRPNSHRNMSTRSNGYQQHPTSQHKSQQQQQQQQAYNIASKTGNQRNQKSLDEVTNMLNSVVNDFGSVQMRNKKPQQSQQQHHSQQQQQHGSHHNNNNSMANSQQQQQQQQQQHNSSQSNPFETINQEKINPSRVEAMHNMFERNNGPTTTSSWRTQHPQPFKPHREEDSYYDIAEFSVKPYKRVSPPRQIHTASTTVVRHASPQEYTPAYPLSQPPQHPPGARNGSANSSTNGGYYSSNSSTAGPNPTVARRSSIVGRQSLSSRAPSVDDEDDGFYDNIGVFDDRRYSRGSELDVASISSRQLPPTHAKQNKIGSFLRKIGATSRPPGAAASLISLNKVANESPMQQGMLTKSNSMSSEPWKKQVLDQREGSAAPKGGLGTRLRNSLFGSKKRLNG